MKIRNGFVSNSSSSSFVLIAKSDAFKEKFEKIKDEDKKLINLIIEEDISTIDGINIYNFISDECDVYENISNEFQEISKIKDDDKQYEAINLKLNIFYNFIEELKKDKKNFVINNIQM
jgi:uncharacterized protein YaaW (UPF0174 family)